MPLIPELRVKIRGAEAGYTEKACLGKQNKRKQKSPFTYFREESKNSILQSILSMKREREIAPMREGKEKHPFTQNQKDSLSQGFSSVPQTSQTAAQALFPGVR